jgi:hypothetical protein
VGHCRGCERATWGGRIQSRLCPLISPLWLCPLGGDDFTHLLIGSKAPNMGGPTLRGKRHNTSRYKENALGGREKRKQSPLSSIMTASDINGGTL